MYVVIILDTFDVISAFENDITLVDFGQLNSKSNLYAFSWKEIQPLINKVKNLQVGWLFMLL